MSKFFINRPIVAMVIAILMVIVGAVTITSLPVALFPDIAPPEVQVVATYVGADAQTIEQSVATPIEQQMSGVDNLNYMYSLNSTADGVMRLIVDYDVKTNPNTDLILTQIRETQAASQLPSDVTNFGVTVQKTVTAPLMLVTLYSPNGTYDARFLANYAYINLADQITRSYGIGSVQIFGAGQYAMRLWVKPDQLAKLAITVPEIVTAIQSQNTVNPAGQVGSEPVPKGQVYTYSVRAQGRLSSPEEFGEIVVRESPGGAMVRLKDVARVELGAQNYSVVGRLNGKPGAIIAVYQLPGSNAVEAANGVRKLFAEVKTRLPSDMDYVLSLVFIPTAFIPGITGRLYQQFAVTIAISVILSAFNALTLSPALAALLLRPRTSTGGLLKAFFRWFNHAFANATNAYVRMCGVLIRKSAIALILLAAFGTAAGWFGSKVPSSFLPDEDQGYLYINLQLPSAASLQRTDEVARKIENALANTPGVQYTTSVVGFSLLSFVRTSYNAFFFVTLKPWDDRKSRDQQLQAIKQRINQELSTIPEGIAFSFSPPAIPGVGTSGGFTFVLEDRSGKDVGFLASNLQTFMTAARKRPEIAGLSTTFLASVPQQFVNVDRDKVIKQGVAVGDVYKTLQAFMGGLFINYFNRFGRQWQVYIEAEGDYRTRAENVGQFYVRSNRGQMVPLATLTRFESRSGPEFTMRFNEYRSAQINGAAAPGYSAGQAMAALEEVFSQTMPHEMGFDYLGISFQEKKAQQGVPPAAIFGFSLLFVFLILAALYESWSLPFSVLLSTPIAVFGAFGILWLRRTVLSAFLPSYMVQIESDVYSQIGLVMLIGLAAKNAILIVEFAKDEYEKGKPLVDAALEGARLRLRPILMTSFAFILGSLPLWTASGAGAVARQIMGTTVIGGMLAASLIGVFFIPVVFYLVEKWSGAGKERASTAMPSPTPAEGN